MYLRAYAEGLLAIKSRQMLDKIETGLEALSRS